MIYCKPWFDNDDWKIFHAMWHSVLYVEIIDKFELAWSVIQFKFEKNTIIDYLKTEIICFYKKKMGVTSIKLLIVIFVECGITRWKFL